MEQLGGGKGWSQDNNRYGKIHKTKDCLRRREAREQRIGKGVREGLVENKRQGEVNLEPRGKESG